MRFQNDPRVRGVARPTHVPNFILFYEKVKYLHIINHGAFFSARDDLSTINHRNQSYYRNAFSLAASQDLFGVLFRKRNKNTKKGLRHPPFARLIVRSFELSIQSALDVESLRG